MVTFAFYCFLLIILTRMRNGETSTTGNFYLFSKFVWFWWLLNKRVCFIVGGTTCYRTFLMFKVTRCFKMIFNDSILLWVRRNDKVPIFRFHNYFLSFWCIYYRFIEIFQWIIVSFWKIIWSPRSPSVVYQFQKREE